MAQHNDLGALGEQLAVNYLVAKNYKIVAQNWRYKKAEIDIIAQLDTCLVCIEVKTRSSTAVAEPESFVTPKKVKLLVAAMNQYITLYDLDLEIRFDIVTVILNNKETKINHIESAFFHF